jgi:mannosyltransferase
MFAVIATQLLITAMADGRWRWWAAYGAAIALTGMFSAFALLILFAHGATLLVTAARTRNLAADPYRHAVGLRRDQGGDPAGGGAGGVLRPGRGMPPSPAGIHRDRGRAALADAAAADPAGGLPGAPGLRREIHRLLPAGARAAVRCRASLARLVAAASGGRRVPWLAWAPSAVLAAAMAVLLAGPQQSIRLTSARPDNLRAVSAIVAANERPGDAVIYLPSEARVVSMGYPAAFRRLRDIALARSPVASATLTGVQVPAAALPGRFAGVRRTWLVSWRDEKVARRARATGRADLLTLLSGMRLIRQWTVRSVVLRLYEARPR